jgi:hypothetical protein
MNVIGHYDEGMEVETVEDGLAVFDRGDYGFCDARVFEPEWAGEGAVEFLIDSTKLLSGVGVGGGLEFLREIWRERALETPSDENAFARWTPVGRLREV